ncbi:MAG: helix-turn-helix transcriptional regulator [Clostridia bacterium]|nr:helix-turn-helix transcriptional regulator [Clostridia bacterium]
MFYNQPLCGFRLLNVFRIRREKRDKMATGRAHSGLSYRIRGSATFYVGNTSLRAGDGTIAYIPRGVDYRNQNSGQEELITVHLQAYGEEHGSFEVLDGMEELEPMFQELLQIWESGEPSAYNRAMVQLYRIFETVRQKKEKDRLQIPAVIAPGVELLRQRFRDPAFSVAEMAEVSFVSEVYFRRIYRAHFGESPLQTVLELRFQYARNLLSSGYYTPKQVAELSGFSDVKYFRTAFKRRYGETASEYMAKK